MVNQYTKVLKATPPAHAPGIACGECGLPGLGVRQVPLRGKPGSTVPMLVCRFCHVGKVVGLVQQGVDTPHAGG